MGLVVRVVLNSGLCICLLAPYENSIQHMVDCSTNHNPRKWIADNHQLVQSCSRNVMLVYLLLLPLDFTNEMKKWFAKIVKGCSGHNWQYE